MALRNRVLPIWRLGFPTFNQIMPPPLFEPTLIPSLEEAEASVAELLLAERLESGWWAGELSTSALSTSTAVMALQMARRTDAADGCDNLITDGLQWLADHQNDDGGWGDTTRSLSNISTTMLASAVFRAIPESIQHQDIIERSDQYITVNGGVDAVIRRYGNDRTFSVPILTHCALAGTVDWDRVIPLPFELACIPARLYHAVRIPVVSYALPALIAIGQVIFRHQGHRNPLVRWIRRRAIRPSLRVLEKIQPDNGGFLEATPLTSFVCMSLLGCGLSDHPVTKRCLQFIRSSVRPDGSWPIDTNLTTWVTTLSINALSGNVHSTEVNPFADRLDNLQRDKLRQWLMNQQYRQIHPYTGAAPGGWAWTDLPGGVPDADDTPGAMLALLNLRLHSESRTGDEADALQAAALWLLDLQNRDGGWPTFCRGWGTLPFDRSTSDLTAHALRALSLWQARVTDIPNRLCVRTERAIAKGLRFLEQQQADDGSWVPLWFGNQWNDNDLNPLYGTARVTTALRELGLHNTECCGRGMRWLLNNQNDDGSWSARRNLPGSIEETGLAVEALCGDANAVSAVENGLHWLIERVSNGDITQPSPIGFYFSKLWYFENLYPIIFALSAFRRAVQVIRSH